MVRLKDVAERAGVSEGAASLALNKKPGISSETRRKVLKAAEELGYTPNRIARGLATRRTHTIGLVVTDIENPFFGSVTRYITEYLHEHEYTAILSVSRDDIAMESTIVERFISNRVDGVIVVPSLLSVAPSHIGYVKSLRAHGIPLVYCTSYYPGISANCVMGDLEGGSYRLTRYLVEMGHREILLFATRNTEVVPSALRVAGYKRALQEAGLPFTENYIIPCRYPDYSTGYSQAMEILRTRKPDAITAINDFLALGIAKAVWESGLTTPGDISVAGYDDVLFASTSRYTLTTVRQNIPEICRETVQLLMDRLDENEGEYITTQVPTELLVRETTGRCNSLLSDHLAR